MTIFASTPFMVCPLCLGSGQIAYGPWGVNPPKKTCPDCGGRRMVQRAHEANRILVDARDDQGNLGGRAGWQAWLDYLEADFGRAAYNDGTYTPEECDHARRVLARLLTVLPNPEGWQYPNGMPTSNMKRHYFRDGSTLCGKYDSHPSGLPLEADWIFGDECSTCLTKFTKERI